MKYRGFTLVEMLIVLALIGVLAGLSFPVFSRVREKGRRTTCQSNLKQIGLAVQQYVQDNNGRYPTLASLQATDIARWNVPIRSYLKSEAVFRCPSRQKPLPLYPATDYGYNWLTLNGTQEASIVFPIHVPLNDEGGGSSYDGGPDTDVIDTSFAGPIWQPALHSGGANFSYIDGHIKWRSIQDQLSAG